jgi:hypothetical protein
MSGPNEESLGAQLSAGLRETYVWMLATHRNDPLTGKCPVCFIARCPEWVHAFERLAVAGVAVVNQPAPDPDRS